MQSNKDPLQPKINKLKKTKTAVNTNFFFSSDSLIPPFQKTGANLAKELKPGSEKQDLAKQETAVSHGVRSVKSMSKAERLDFITKIRS